MSNVHYLVVKEKNKKTINYFEYEKLAGFNMTSKNKNIKLKDAINVNKMIIINPSFIEKLINKKIDNYRELLNKSLKYLKEEYGDKIISYTDTKGGLFYLVKFNEEVDKNIFESGNNYYIDNGHEKETRINICSFM